MLSGRAHRIVQIRSKAFVVVNSGWRIRELIDGLLPTRGERETITRGEMAVGRICSPNGHTRRNTTDSDTGRTSEERGRSEHENNAVSGATSKPWR